MGWLVDLMDEAADSNAPAFLSIIDELSPEEMTKLKDEAVLKQLWIASNVKKFDNGPPSKEINDKLIELAGPKWHKIFAVESHKASVPKPVGPTDEQIKKKIAALEASILENKKQLSEIDPADEYAEIDAKNIQESIDEAEKELVKLKTPLQLSSMIERKVDRDSMLRLGLRRGMPSEMWKQMTKKFIGKSRRNKRKKARKTLRRRK